MNYADLYNPKKTPQTEPMDDRQVKNNAGGFVFQIDCWSRLDRFLILGADSATYYQKARALTRENAKCVIECLNHDSMRTIERAKEISVSGRAPKNDPAIFVLALAAVHENVHVRSLAYEAIPIVCRTATHLFMFIDICVKLGKGWGRGFKRAVAAWYSEKPTNTLALQAIKYRSRHDYDHKRLLRLAHPMPDADPARDALHRWIVDRDYDPDALPAIVDSHLKVMAMDRPADMIPLIKEHRLPWEAIPTGVHRDPDIWRAMLPSMGMTALIRNLGRLTEIGVIKPLSDAEAAISDRLENEEGLRKSRIHPYAILQALAVYRAGNSVRGSGSWVPSTAVMDALDGAFYKAFSNVEPTGKRHLLALDVSGSMTWPENRIGGVLTAREASAALAMVTMATEQRSHVVAFAGGLRSILPLSISPKMRLTDVVAGISRLPAGGTDCALPMLYAMENGLSVDVFVIYTDNETWCGSIHAVQALRQYREKTGINAKLIVVGMTSTGFSIADPDDGGMLDVVGFDSGVPELMADFIRS
ncbi:TROVE domain-containing protein [Roseibium sp. Sym1]|uniref:TROVE domain-containing protein n=1 Tax=Roseibium sp. Sym1 TaxID=3016006 RepID=UPI0022B49F9B|nr:TROVE domain-containing protein [Roseibium sp. Sym1]